MSSTKPTEAEIDPSRRDSAGNFILHLSRIVAFLSALAVPIALLATMVAMAPSFADGSLGPAMALLLTTAALVSLCFGAIASIAFWTNFKRLADDVYVVRQHIEFMRGRKGDVAESESVGQDRAE